MGSSWIRLSIPSLAVVGLAVCLASPAAGLLSLDAITVETGTTTLTSTSLAHETPSGSNRLLLVSTFWDDGNDGALASMTYGGETLTCLAHAERKDEVGTQTCYLVSPPTGSHTLDVSWGISVAEWGIVARSLTDVNQTDPIGARQTVNGSSSDATGSLTTTDPDSTIVTALTAKDGTLSLDPASGMDEDAEDAAGLLSTGISVGAGRTNTTTTGGYTSGWSVSAAQPWVLDLIEILRTPEQVSYNQSGSSGGESISPVSVGVTMDRESSEEVTVDYSVTGGNATSDDHNVSSGTVTFAAGSTFETISLDITDDRSDEPDETLELTLENPQGAERGPPKTHTYTITDDDPNHAPDPSPASVSTDEDTDVSDTVTATDQDQDDTVDSYAVDTSPSHGALTFDTSTGAFTYSPEADYDGSDSFTFVATDNHGATSAAATVDITVNGVNDAPTASDDSATTDEDTTVWIDVLANDSDVDGDALSVAASTSPTHGSTSLPGNGTIEYTPDADYNGADSFTYDVTDGTLTGSATVSLTVDPVNDAPTAAGDDASTNENETVWIDVLANDTDVDGDTLSIASASDPANGTTSLPGNGTVAYTPDPGFSGVDAFSYDVTDGALTDTASVSVAVSATQTITSSVEVLSWHVRVVNGSMDAKPTVNTTAMGSSLNIQLENATGGIELASMGADGSTTLEVNLTFKNFTPTVLMGRARVVDWSNTTNGDGTENVSLELDPIAMAFIDDCATYTSFMGYCGPSSVDKWPTNSSEDQADVAFDAAVRVFLSDLSYLPESERSDLEGAFMTTDAQALGQMNVSGADSPGGASLTMPVAGPHLLPNGSTNEGFFEARLPDALLSSWGIQDPSVLTGTYQGANRTVSVTNVSQGTLVSMAIHYSSGNVSIGEDTTAPDADAGSDQSVYVRSTVTFDGSGSTDNQAVTSYTWDFGDGTNGTGETPSHTYDETGTYQVTLNVSDAAGSTDTDTVNVTVEAQTTAGGGGGAVDWYDDEDGTDETEEDADDATDDEATETGGGGGGSNASIGDPATGDETDLASSSSGPMELPRAVTGADSGDGASGGSGETSGSSGEARPITSKALSNAFIVVASICLVVGFPLFAARRMT